MHSQTKFLNSSTSSTSKYGPDHDQDLVHDQDHDHNCQSNILDTDPDAEADVEPVVDNNPPDSFWVSQTKVTDWLDQHTYIERKASVKLVTISRNFDPAQTRSSQRSFSFNHKPKAAIIGFGQKPSHHNHHHAEKSKQNDKPDNVRLFRNRSEPGRDYVQQVNEPVSPRVSCIGRVRSKRDRGGRVGFWKNVKAAFSNRGQKKTGRKLVDVPV